MASTDTNDLNLGATLRGAAADQKLFGRYTLKKVLGRGGMGVVWLAHDDELVRNVAMKFLPDMIVRDREAVEDLKRETRRSLDLTHHHIVRIYDFTQDDQCAAIIMEYVDGESLSALKTRQEGGCFSVTTIQSWVSHFCQAMDYAHRQARVVHRDLKPANLMVNGRGDLKVTDFGISRSMSDSMTRVSMSNSAGTLAYMSPEQALGSPPAVGDDIYAFGATVYDMLTGRPPFFRGNLQVQLETVTPPPMETRRAELGNTGEPIPALWEEVIAACLAKRPQDRPQGMMEIASLLGVSGTTTAGFRPTTHRGGGAHGPGTSPTAPAAGTNSTTAATEVPKTGTAPTHQPPTARTAASNRALQPTRAEDVLFGYTPPSSRPSAPAPTARTTPTTPPAETAPPVEPEPVAPTVVPEPEPVAEAVAEPPVIVPPAEPPPAVEPEPVAAVEAEPEPVVAEAPPPEVTPESMTLEMSPVPMPMEIPLVPPTDKPAVEPPAEREFAATLIMPAVEPPAEVVPSKPEPERPAAYTPPTTPITVRPPATSRSNVPPPAPSTSTRTNVGHMIGSGTTKKSTNRGLILGGGGAVLLVVVLGLWAMFSKPPKPDPRQVELASHVAAANTALAGDNLDSAKTEIEAVKSLDPNHAGLAALQDSLQQKESEKAEREKEKERIKKDNERRLLVSSHLAAATTALANNNLNAVKSEIEAVESLDAKNAALPGLKSSYQKARDAAANAATATAAAEADAARQRQFEGAVEKTNDAIERSQPTTARKHLANAKDMRPNDPEISKLDARIDKLEEEIKRAAAIAARKRNDDEDDGPKKGGGKNTGSKNTASRNDDDDRPPPVKPRPDPVTPKTTTPKTNPRSNPFGPGGAPGG